MLSQSGFGPADTPERRVRWRRSQVRTFTAGAVVCIASILVILFQAYRQGRESIRLQTVTRPTTATITRRWKTAVGNRTEYWVAYRYPELPARVPDPAMKVTHLWWAEMSPGSHLSIAYNPAAPESNGLTGEKPHLFRRWIWTGGVTSLFCILLLLTLYIIDWRRKRAELWLVQEGQTAVGEIMDLIETMVVRGDRQIWRYDITYRYPLPDGTLTTSSRTEVRPECRDWEIGSMVTVFFDPRNPARHALYGDLPGEVVAAE